VPGGRKTPEELRDRIVELTRLGWSAPMIAENVGVCTRTVQRVRVKRKVGGNGGVPFSEEERLLARDLFDDGASRNEVARTLGRTMCVIARHFPEDKWTPQQVKEFQSLVRQGRRLDDILSGRYRKPKEQPTSNRRQIV
jgi:IS30 family transposase